MANSFHPGAAWLDTEGKPIQAHGFSVFYDEKDRCFYWFGENKEFTLGGKDNTVWTWGVRAYRSHDLYHWEDCGLIIPPTPDDPSSPLFPSYMMDRPHVIYCGKTGQYVMWLKIMAGNTSQFMSVLASSTFLGPYHFVHEMLKPLAMNTGDFTLVKDEGNNKAYFIFERPHFELVTAELADDYTDVNGVFSEHYQGRVPPLAREAPTFFSRGGLNYLLTSGTTGYAPNPSEVCAFRDFHGPYQDLGDPCLNDKHHTSFDAQFTCVLHLPKSDFYVAMADRWLPFFPERRKGWGAAKAMDLAVKSGERNDIAIPDYSPQKLEPLSGKTLIHEENISRARYVWLPLEFKDEKPVLSWRSSWSLSDFGVTL
jgi:hypothetical protein